MTWRKMLTAMLCPVLIGLTLLLGQSGAQAATSPPVKDGGSMTIGVVGTSWYPFDPPEYSNGTTHANYFDAIFGQLFVQEPDGSMEPSIASGYHYSNGNKDVTIDIRKGVKFSNGMPVTAQVAQWNFTRDMITVTSCACHPCFTNVQSVSTSGPLSVVIHMKEPNATIINCFEGHAPNYLIPPSVLKADGSSKFGLHPIGAGPFEVKLDQPDSRLELVKNPTYWNKGTPHLDSLTFVALAQDQPAYAALQSGEIQMAIGVTTPSIIQEAKSGGFRVQPVKATSMGMLQFNTSAPPFNKLAAREAVSYAIDSGPILNATASGEGSTAQGMQGPGGLFFSAKVPGFHAYNPAKAKALVKQLGGLSMTIQGGNTATQETEEGAINTELAAAGIKVTLVPEELPVEVDNFSNGKWQAIVGCAGGADPDVGGCSYPERFSSHAEYSGANDPTLSSLITEEQNTIDKTKRAALQKQVDQRIAQNVYAVPLFAQNTYVLSSTKINPTNPGPGGGGAIGITLDEEQLGYLK